MDPATVGLLSAQLAAMVSATGTSVAAIITARRAVERERMIRQLDDRREVYSAIVGELNSSRSFNDVDRGIVPVITIEDRVEAAGLADKYELCSSGKVLQLHQTWYAAWSTQFIYSGMINLGYSVDQLYDLCISVYPDLAGEAYSPEWWGYSKPTLRVVEPLREMAHDPRGGYEAACKIMVDYRRRTLARMRRELNGAFA